MILDIILICLIVLCGFLYYRQDKIIKAQNEYIDGLENKLVNNINSISATMTRMKEIDSKGGFESDDEVGQIFNGLKDQIRDLQDEITNG